MTKVQRLLSLVGEIAAAAASGAAAGHGGAKAGPVGPSRGGGQVSVNNLGQIPVVPFPGKRKKKLKR